MRTRRQDGQHHTLQRRRSMATSPPRPTALPYPFVERRAHPRRSAMLTVRYRRIDPNDLSACQDEYRCGVCRNISLGGMLLETDVHIPPGQVLEIYATERCSDTTIYGVVETVRAARNPDHYDIGVRFLQREEI